MTEQTEAKPDETKVAAPAPADNTDTSKEDVAKPDQQSTDETEATETTDDKQDDAGDVWGSTGDDIGDSVLGMLKDAGTTPETAKALLWDAVQAGDPTKIDRDALVEAVGKDRANLIMAGVENYVGRIAARTKEVTKTVHDAVSGEENWNAIRDWAKKSLSESDMLDYIQMIDAGGRKAALAAKDLAEQYVDAGNTLSTKTGVEPSGKATPKQAPPLSRKDYFDAVQKLHKTGKPDRAALDQLFKQRELGKQRGL